MVACVVLCSAPCALGHTSVIFLRIGEGVAGIQRGKMSRFFEDPKILERYPNVSRRYITLEVVFLLSLSLVSFPPELIFDL